MRLSALASFLVGTTVGPISAGAQQDPRQVQPERPSVATHAYTVSPGWLEFEFGIELDRFEDHSRGGFAPLYFKLGLASNLQLGVLAPVVAPPGPDNVGLGDMTLGLKWRLADGLPIVGQVAVQPSLKLATGSSASGTGSSTTDVGMMLIASNSFGPVAVDVNVSYTRRGGDGSTVSRDATLWALAAGGPVTGSVGWVGEVFGLPGTSGTAGQPGSVALLFGPTLAVRAWLGLDVSVIVPLTGPQPSAVLLGGTWNIGRVW